MTDHLSALDYEYLAYYFKRDTDIYVFYRIDKMWKFKERVESLYDKEDEMTEEEIAALEKMN